MNINNAYVSGMRDEVGFKGDQLNQVLTCFTVGYGFTPNDQSLLTRPADMSWARSPRTCPSNTSSLAYGFPS